MVPLLTETAKEYDGLELTISVGDLAKGWSLAQKGFHANFDVIISRGGTARLLKQSVSLPVIEIGTTVYDVLCTLQRANIHEGRWPLWDIPTSHRIWASCGRCCHTSWTYLPYNPPARPLPRCNTCGGRNMPRSQCDMVTYTAAKEMDVNAFLITSSAESIRAAFDQAVFFCSANRQLRSENQFLRQLLHKRTSQTVVFTRAGKLVFSTLEDASAELLDMLREKKSRAWPPRDASRSCSSSAGCCTTLKRCSFLRRRGLYRLLFSRFHTPCRRGQIRHQLL